MFWRKAKKPERKWEWSTTENGHCLIRDDGMIVARIFHRDGEFEVFPQIGWFRNDVTRFVDIEKAKRWALLAVTATPP